jgi:methanogenic corrinoid protein MtbC1
MERTSLSRRVTLAGKLSAAREELARAAGWDLTGAVGLDDGCHLVEVLAAAIEAAHPLAFEEFVRWAARLVSARHIDPAALVASLERLGRAACRHLEPAERQVLMRYVEAGIRAARSNQPAPEPECVAPATPLGVSRDTFLSAIVRGDASAARRIVFEALACGADLLDVYVGILQGALYELGVLWEQNRISVTQEHMASAIAQSVITELYAELEPAGARRGTVLITGVPGEQHQIGAQLVADVLELHGWDVQLLGPESTERDIIASLRETGAEVLGISATMLATIPRVRQVVAAVRDALGEDQPRIVLGGGAFQGAAALGLELGADGVAEDARGAVALLGM